MRSPTQTAAIAIAAYFISNLQPLAAQDPQLTITVIASVDYPGLGNSTTVQGINDLGDVTGYFEDSSGAIRSFIRYADGTFSDPIVEPNDVGNMTIAKDIDNTGRICGYYFGSDPTPPETPYRGFFLSGTTFTEFELPGSNSYITGINDAGDFCGHHSSVLDPDHLQAFLYLANGYSVGWVIGDATECNAINVHSSTVGDFQDTAGRWHGNLTATEVPRTRIRPPIDYPGATDTFFYAIDDSDRIIVGKYVDNARVTHGLILQRPDTWASFDYPGVRETSLNGINNNKLVSGYYVNRTGIHRGFIGKIHVLSSQ